MEKPKQRAAYFTDSEWERVKRAASNSDQRNLSHFVNIAVMKLVKWQEKKEIENEVIKRNK